ncbi:MAG: hypothetical protein ACTS73_01455 [Arsenophonus sp. NEOnobi-MAG3]
MDEILEEFNAGLYGVFLSRSSINSPILYSDEANTKLFPASMKLLTIA